MSALAMVLMAGMAVGDVPKQDAGEAQEQRLDLSGKWEGNVSHQAGWTINAVLMRGYLAEWDSLGGEMRVTASYRISVSDEGPGQLSLSLDGKAYAGIYRQSKDEVTLCYRLAELRRPTSFQVGDGQHLLTLRRVKPRK